MGPTTVIDTQDTDTLPCLEAIRTTLRMAQEGDMFAIWYIGGNDPVPAWWWTTVTRNLAQEADIKIRVLRGRGRILVKVLA